MRKGLVGAGSVGQLLMSRRSWNCGCALRREGYGCFWASDGRCSNKLILGGGVVVRGVDGSASGFCSEDSFCFFWLRNARFSLLFRERRVLVLWVLCMMISESFSPAWMYSVEIIVVCCVWFGRYGFGGVLGERLRYQILKKRLGCVLILNDGDSAEE